MVAMRRSAVVLVGSLLLGACAKGGGGAPGAAPNEQRTAGATPATPKTAESAEFDQKWTALAAKEVDAFYVEDDRGEGLMGNVRRARHEQPPADKSAQVGTGRHESLSQAEIQQVIRQNLPGVKACYLRVSHQGEPRSGKAIVSFEVGPAGDVRGTKVDAPSFQGTSLPTCVTAMVSHWAFPKSQTGSLATSYPFVFVGG
jgi:hypothetical protein